MKIRTWMSWEGGVDLVAATRPDLAMPNVVVHLARMVHTPIGSAPAGLVLYQPDPAAMPLAIGFVSTDQKLAAWFGPNIFAGTPFEAAPALAAKIHIDVADDRASSRLEVMGHVFETVLSQLAPGELIHRPAGAPMPFAQQGLEASAGKVDFRVDGKPIAVIVPKMGIGGGAAAVFSACGVYAR
ncbi:MAG: hypothetical protein ABL997_13555 [Planctomycetota bacterium]